MNRKISIKKSEKAGKIRGDPFLEIADRVYDIVGESGCCDDTLRGINVSVDRGMRSLGLPDVTSVKYEIFYYYPAAPGNELKIEVTWESSDKGHLFVKESNFCRSVLDTPGLTHHINFKLPSGVPDFNHDTSAFNVVMAYGLVKAIEIYLHRANEQMGHQVARVKSQEESLKEVSRDYFTIV